MTQKWNLQDIRPPENRTSRRQSQPTLTRPTETQHQVSRVSKEEIPNVVIIDGNKKKKYKFVTAFSAFFFIIAITGIIVVSTGRTTLTVYPEFREPTVNETFTAYPEPRSDSLSYEILSFSAVGERQVKATGQITVEEQATGFIEIIKTTPGTERLIKNTRFRSPDGLIFRIQESIVVPGAITNENGATEPGSIRAEVFADQIGDQYNLPSGTKFDIPGFQESGLTQLFETIYAENRTAFTGGFSGPQFQIADDELATAKQSLQMELRDTLLDQIDEKILAGFTYFPDSVAITFASLPAVQYGDDLVTIQEEATLQIPLFSDIALGSFLASKVVTTYNREQVKIDDISTLSFSYTDQLTSSQVLADKTALEFKLVGKPLLIWQYDAVDLAKNLAGLPKTAAENAFSAYPGLRGGRVEMTPFWRRTFPSDPSEITIVNELRDPR